MSHRLTWRTNVTKLMTFSTTEIQEGSIVLSIIEDKLIWKCLVHQDEAPEQQRRENHVLYIFFSKVWIDLDASLCLCFIMLIYIFELWCWLCYVVEIVMFNVCMLLNLVKSQVLTYSRTCLDYIIQNILRMSLDYIIWTNLEWIVVLQTRFGWFVVCNAF